MRRVAWRWETLYHPFRGESHERQETPYNPFRSVMINYALRYSASFGTALYVFCFCFGLSSTLEALYDRLSLTVTRSCSEPTTFQSPTEESYLSVEVTPSGQPPLVSSSRTDGHVS
jgi:hypothetical protein